MHQVPVPCDGQEGPAVQFLLDGALQTVGVPMARGIPIAGQQRHQQKKHVHQEALVDRGPCGQPGPSPVTAGLWPQLGPPQLQQKVSRQGAP